MRPGITPNYRLPRKGSVWATKRAPKLKQLQDAEMDHHYEVAIVGGGETIPGRMPPPLTMPPVSTTAI